MFTIVWVYEYICDILKHVYVLFNVSDYLTVQSPSLVKHECPILSPYL